MATTLQYVNVHVRTCDFGGSLAGVELAMVDLALAGVELARGDLDFGESVC